MVRCVTFMLEWIVGDGEIKLRARSLFSPVPRLTLQSSFSLFPITEGARRVATIFLFYPPPPPFSSKKEWGRSETQQRRGLQAACKARYIANVCFQRTGTPNNSSRLSCLKQPARNLVQTVGNVLRQHFLREPLPQYLDKNKACQSTKQPVHEVHSSSFGLQ
uniref:Uncharacterized protein n=1 Tax=Timema monikensis TaxID=170555 RepID=A0A7R9E103_9NEOP|nr:unnamed protein product [Timema monikensis]